MKTEYKDYRPSFKDIDQKRGTAIIKHAAFNIDLGNDQIERNAFDDHYRSNPKIDFLLNHHNEQDIGSVMRVYADPEGAYSFVKFGEDPLSQGLMEMADQKALSGVSMGYIPERHEYVYTLSKRVRKLKKIQHKETSLLVNKPPMNPEAGVVELYKSMDYVHDRVEHIKNLERFLTTSRKAPDSLLQQVALEIKAAKSELSEYTYDDYMDDCDRLELKLNGLSGDIKQMQKRLLLNELQRIAKNI